MAAAAPHCAAEDESGADRPAPGAGPNFLLELIVADLHWSSLQIGSLALLTARACACASMAGLLACRHLVYDDTRVMRLALRYDREAGLPDGIGRKLDRLYVAIGEAVAQMAPFVEPVAGRRAGRDQASRVLPALRRTAQQAAECLIAIEGATRAGLGAEYREDSRVLLEFLGRAARGDLSDLDHCGVLVAPKLMQRRHSPRVKVSRPCRLVAPAGEFSAELVDVSRAGLGLICEGALALGDKVVAQIGSRRFEAMVRRLDGRRIGLVLDHPLPVGDRLFTGG